jgi:hypothetical protein
MWNMRRLYAVATVGASLVAAPALGEMILWDNFPPTAEFPDGFDPAQRLTSERDTQIGFGPEAATWTIDDFHFPGEPGGELFYELNRIEWVGVRELQERPGFGYDLADWAIFTRMPRPGEPGEFDFAPLFSADDVVWTEEEDFGSVPGNSSLNLFRGSIDVSGVALDPGVNYWVGVRLVGNEANQSGGTAGRHFVAVGTGDPASIDEGYNFDPNFQLDPVWVRASDRNPFGDPLEFAYRLNATLVPEPSSLALLLIGAAFSRLRRRRSR